MKNWKIKDLMNLVQNDLRYLGRFVRFDNIFLDEGRL